MIEDPFSEEVEERVTEEACSAKFPPLRFSQKARSGISSSSPIYQEFLHQAFQSIQGASLFSKPSVRRLNTRIGYSPVTVFLQLGSLERERHRAEKQIEKNRMDPLLIKSARSSDATSLELLIGQKPELLHQVTPQNKTALHIAVEYESIPCAQFLYSRFPELLRRKSTKGDTVLHIAARLGYSSLAGVLINWAKERGAFDLLSLANAEGNTTLHEAARHGHLPVAELLLAEDPTLPCSTNFVGESPLYLAAERGYPKFVDLILSIPPEGVDRRTRAFYGGPKGRTSLHAAVVQSHFYIVNKLVEALPELVKEADSYGSIPLHYAASMGCLDVVRVLIQPDSSLIYLLNKDGDSPIHMAAKNGHCDVTRELVQLRPDCGELRDGKGRNALHVAVESGKRNVVKYILETPELKNLINEQDDEGNTPLHLAAINRQLRIIYLLFWDEKVDLKLVNNQKQTAVDIVRSDRSITMILQRLLISTSSRESVTAKSGDEYGISDDSDHVDDSSTEPGFYDAMFKASLVVLVFVASFCLTKVTMGTIWKEKEGLDLRNANQQGDLLLDAVIVMVLAAFLLHAGILDQLVPTSSDVSLSY
ncbi:protein ACCELERATED CELL DEATH 6-like [Aristolochia californica]|uniref:protein ACCELERATED CELL DEATH 6-like n=1 Tax=Aristolochia californica TaxID=171875 RepID=UPI0035DDDD58